MGGLDALKKLNSGLICTSGGCFQMSLVWIRLLVLMNGCLQELNGVGFFFVVLVLQQAGAGTKQNTAP